MRYEDASGAFQASGPIANDDADTLAAGSRGPATGNLITGEGTQYGASGADSAAGAHVAAIAGQGGEDSSFSGGKLSVAGQFGNLTVDAEGNYSYLANKGAPENVRDRFTYTLADNQGNTDTGALIVEIGKTPAVIKADAQQIIPGPDGVVTLPPGVELSDIMVVGRNLVVNMPDGTQLIIVDGAVFVPQLSLGGVEVPATNVAALLIGQEVQPAAGETPPSSGGNFALPPPPLDPGVPLGDLLPPTEYTYTPPEPQQVFDILDEEPEIFVQPDGQPAQVNAVDQVEEAGLPTRNGGEPAGSAESADGNGADNDVTSETTTGTIIIDSPDGVDSVTINGVVVTGAVGQVIAGAFGTLTITGFVGDDILYSYTLSDNTSGNDTHDDFAVVLTDEDGDQAAATLRIDIIDDVPTARPDTDFIPAGQFGPATGNVITDASAGDAGDSDTNAADTVGADNATVTAVSSVNVPANSDGSAPFVVNGQYGVLTLNADGSYSYVRNPGTPGGVNDVFNYTLTDGDGDTSTTTLTISIGDATPQTGENPVVRTDDDAVPGEGGNPSGVGDDIDAQNLAGTLAGSGGDGPLSFDLLLTGAPAGFTYVDGPGGSVLVQQVQDGSPVTVLTITINAATGAYTVTQNAPILHPTLNGQEGDDTENNVSFTINYNVTDIDGDSAAGTLTIDVDDDTPVATQTLLTGVVDEDGLAGGNPGGVNDVVGENTVASGSVASLFSAGADNPLSYSLLTDTSGLPALTSNGAAVTYSVSGNTLTASANGSPVFTFVLNADGSYTFTLLDQLDHPSLDGLPGDDTENEVDLEIALGSIIQATDTDGDSVTAGARGLVITVDDDSPEPFEECPDDVITVNQVGSTFTGNLNLPPVGADQPGIVSFVVEDGDPVLDNEGNPVTSEGDALFYFVNDDGVLEARAGGETGDVIFTITLNGDGTFTYEQVGVFGEGSEFTFSDLTSTSAGNVEFRGVGADDPATTVDLLLSGAVAGVDSTVNTDSDSIGTANQSMDVGETVRIDLVTDLTSGAGTPSGFGYSGHVSSSSFIGLIPQVQGDQAQTVAFTVWALDSTNTQGTEPDRNPAGGFSDSTITAVTEVTVKDFLTGNSTTVDVTGFTVGVFTPVAYGISARVNADGSVTFSGIQQGDSYGFSTGSGDFNAVVVQSEPAGTGGSTQDSFDLGVFSIGIANEFDPFGLEVPIALTDSDGDAVVCDIDISVGVPLDAPEITVTVNEAGLPVIGSDAASNSEIASGDLQSQVSGGTGPYTFTLVSNGNGAFGTLVLNADGTFTYTLDTPFDSQPDADDGTNPELGAETFTFEATDSLGAKQTGTITINIIDDVPTAVDDTDSIAAGQYGPVDGNVITDASAGDAGDSDNGADTKGADGATVVGVAAGDTNADLDNPATVGVVIQGTYGKLTLNADGSYSYVRDAGTDGGVQDVFTYTIEDGDGDRSNATLTITIADSPPTIDAPDEGEAGTVVDEKGLPTRGESPGSGEIADGNGTNNSDTSETTAGVINFTAPDGPAIVRIDGVVVTGVVGQTFNGSHGVLTITSYDAATGQIGYSYTLSDNTSGDATFDDFAIQVEDQDGDLANDTLVIDIIDDTPTANNDVDSVVGGFDPATGNVLTGSEVAVGEDSNGTDGVADVPGADGGRITNIDHAASPAEAVPNGGSTAIQGDYGVLTIYSNGDYSYQRDPGTPGGVSDVFTYTLTDGDGDTDTATLTISIDDNMPTLPDPALIRLDDDVIPGLGGNADGPGDDDPDAVPGNVVNGQLNGSGGDAPLTYNFTGTNTLPSGFSIGAASDADTLIIVQDQNGSPVTVMTIQLDQSDGSFTVTQNAPMWHPADNGGPDDDIENNFNFSIGVEVEDADHDVEPATITINVDDDTPTINVTKGDDSAVTLTTDDAQTIGGASDTAVTAANFAGVFGLTQSAGADGAAAAATLNFALDVTGYTGGPAGVDSGLDQGGNSIFLYEIGDKVVGSTSATLAGVNAGNTVFDVGVSGTGVVTLTQYSQIDHVGGDPTPTGGPPFADHIVSLSDGLVTLTASASLTDNDGDNVTDSETVNIGANLRFTDDGPDVAAVLTGNQIRIDETDGVVAAGGEVDPVGGNLGTVTVAAATLFTVTQPHVSADTPQTLGYALSLSSQGVDSGLDVSSNNASIFLYNIGGQIVGSTALTVGTVNAGNTAFTVSIDANTGAVTMTQFLAVEHPNTASDDEDSLSIAAGALNVVVTATDFDGDTDTASVDLGSVIRFEDDGPTLGVIQNQEASNTPGDPASIGTLHFAVGSDSPAVVTAITANNTGITSGGFNLVTNVVGNVLTAYQDVNGNGTYEAGSDVTAVYTLTVNPGAGTSGQYVFDLITPLDPTVTETLVGGSSSFGAGPTGYQILLNPAGTQDLAVVSGYLVDTINGADGDGVFDFNAWFGGNLSAAQIASAGTNGSVSGWGVENNNFENENELFFFDFGSQATSDPDAGGPFVPPVQGPDVAGDPPEVQLPNISTATFEFINYTSGAGDAGDDIAYVVHYTDGTFDNGWIPANAIDGDVQWKFIADPGKFIADIQFFSGREPSGAVQDLPPGKIDLVSVGVQTSSLTETISFNVTIADADGDPVSGSFTVEVADGNTPIPPAAALLPPDPQSFSIMSSESLLASDGDDQQMQKTAANSNNVIMAAAVAAAGMADSAAAEPTYDPAMMSMADESDISYSTETVEKLAADDEGSNTLAASEPQASEADAGADSSSGNGRGNANGHDNQLDASSNHSSSDDGSSHQAANDQGPAAAEPQVAVAPTVMMASAEQLQAAGLDGEAKHNGSVEKIVAEALGEGDAPTVDGLLAHLSDGLGSVPGLAHVASQDTGSVPGWDMAAHGGFGAGSDMLIKVDVISNHHDAIQPAVNG